MKKSPTQRALEAAIATLRRLPSPEGCGCAARKEHMIAELERYLAYGEAPKTPEAIGIVQAYTTSVPNSGQLSEWHVRMAAQAPPGTIFPPSFGPALPQSIPIPLGPHPTQDLPPTQQPVEQAHRLGMLSRVAAAIRLIVTGEAQR